VWGAALAATAHLPDPAPRIITHRHLGLALADLHRHDEAISQLRNALVLSEQHHDLTEQAHNLRARAWSWEQQGDDQRALEDSI
jgi:tetratricopeptide (TPR) repeat protein